MYGYLSHVVSWIPEISQNGVNVKENLLIVYAGVYWTCDVEECDDIIVCPLNCLHECIVVLSVDLCGMSGDV